MKKEMKDLITSMTETNQQVISLVERLSEVATFSQQMVVFKEKLNNIDSHVKEVASSEVGRRTHLLRRGLEQEKAAAQSRLEKTMNNTSDLSARLEILDNKHDIIKYEVSVLASTIHKEFNATGLQISKLEQDMVLTLYNDSSLFDMVDSLKKTQSDIKSEMKQASDKTRAQIATVQQEVVTAQRNTQSRDETFEKTLSDLNSKTSTIAAHVDTSRGQISRLQDLTGTFSGFSVRLFTKSNSYYNKETVIKFDEVYYNAGGHYSPSTGIFTVPVSGVYVFMFNVQVGPYDSTDKNRKADVVLYVNGDIKAEAIVTGVGSDFTAGNAAVLHVWAGQRVYVSTSNLQERYYIWPWRTSFSGALLHVH
ncbi:hypothetical protein DPMN_184661 [Dreissena polymorpha]|uniref:C1q domain-containing protein n=1 Tax=Dreissena polymorpha TaxID=45954 RepID=A0A9D4I7M0_DREPO|nr:hypothetical protein DPMN_184661 [Dreissena polymorpha]